MVAHVDVYRPYLVRYLLSMTNSIYAKLEAVQDLVQMLLISQYVRPYTEYNVQMIWLSLLWLVSTQIADRRNVLKAWAVRIK